MLYLNTITMMGWSLALSRPRVARGQVVKPTPTYRVRSGVRKRDLQQAVFDPLDMILSFSDDGSAREDEFYLDLFETPDTLTNPESTFAISTAMNAYLLPEINDYFDDMNSVEKVSSEILSLNQRYETTVNSSGQANTRKGTEARMKVILTFDQSPSPKTEAVLDATRLIMTNMTYFVTNLSSALPQTDDDNELSGVYEAIRREIRIPTFVEPPENIVIAVVDIGEGDVGKTDQNIVVNPVEELSPNVLSATVPIVLIVAVLAAIVVFFVFRKRGKQMVPESPKNSAMLYMDVENEVYSMDRSVDTSKSPVSPLLQPMPPHLCLDTDIQFNMSNDSDVQPPSTPGTPGTTGTGGGSVFSGLDSEFGGVLSPRSLSSPKSIMTGYTCGSAATIRASNLNVSSPKSTMTGYTCGSASTIQASNLNNKKKKSITPKSLVTGGSLFAFSEVDEENDDTEDLELLERKQPSTTKSIASHNSEENAYTGNELEGSTDGSTDGDTDETEATSSLEGVSINLPVKSKEEEEIEVTITPSVDKVDGVFQVLADLEDMESAIGPRDPTPTAYIASTARDATPRKSNTAMDGTFASPFKSGGKHEGNDSKKPTVSVASRASNLVSGLFKGKRKSVSTPSSPVSSPRKEGTLSAPASPIQHVGKHWLLSSKTRQSRTTNMPPKLDYNDDDYDMNLSCPSEDESYNDTIKDSIKDSRQIVDRAPQDPPEDFAGGRRHAGDRIGVDGSAMYQNLTPEDLAGGRRHAGDRIGVDGSAMYQNLTPEDLAGGRRHAGDKIGDDGSAMYQANAMDLTSDDFLAGGRRHAGDKIGGDGSAMYQANAMHPTDWSYKSSDAESIGDSTIDETNDSENMPNQYIFKNNMNLLLDTGTDADNEDDDRESANMPNESTRTASSVSASRQLIDDLVWLEKKITATVREEESGVDNADSLSFDDNTDGVYEEETSNDDSIVNENPALLSSADVHATNSAASSIVCKDCFAPPGKLHIVIHSTKDGPAVHTVKEGSSLEGEIFPGDLIIAVDNVDTRSFTAEQVMKMMATKGDKERKITVLHSHEEA